MTVEDIQGSCNLPYTKKCNYLAKIGITLPKMYNMNILNSLRDFWVIYFFAFERFPELGLQTYYYDFQ